MFSFKEYLLEYTGPNIKKSKTDTGFRHASKDNESVHKHLLDQGFKQQGASNTDGSTVTTRYKHSSGTIVDHTKGKKDSFVDIVK